MDHSGADGGRYEKVRPGTADHTVTNGSETVGLDPIGHNFVNEVDKLEWLHADVVLEGVSITKDTRITIKSDAWCETAATSGSSVYRRWFIDNIKLSRAN